MSFKLLSAEEIAALSPEEQTKYQADLEASKTKKPEDEDLVNKLVQERIDNELKPIKEKLDNAFRARDEAMAKAAEYERKEKEANLKRLEDEGKHKEVYELKLAEEKARIAALEKANIELTRDVTVRDVLKGFSFRNESAADLAYREVVAQLVQNETGNWIHRSGVSIKDFVTNFAQSEEMSFLFKPKGNSGAGTNTNNTNNPNLGDDGKPKSLFKMTQAEVLKLAKEGKLPK